MKSNIKKDSQPRPLASTWAYIHALTHANKHPYTEHTHKHPAPQRAEQIYVYNLDKDIIKRKTQKLNGLIKCSKIWTDPHISLHEENVSTAIAVNVCPNIVSAQRTTVDTFKLRVSGEKR